MSKQVVALEVTANASQAEGSVKSLKAQLKEAQADVAKMADKFGETSVQAIEAAKRAAELKDRIGDAKALTEAFNPDKKFQAFSSALSGVAGGFSAVTGAMGLLGAETGEVEKMMLKVQSAMALSQGLSAVTESIDAFKNLGAFVKSFTIVQRISTAAQWLWNAAMNANPIGAIIIAVTALIAGITALVSWFKKSSEAAKEQAASAKAAAKAADDHKKALDQASEALDRNQKFQMEMAKASDKSKDEIRKLEKALIDKKIADKEAAAQTAMHNVQLAKQALAAAKAADASDEVIKSREETLKKERDTLEEANKQVLAAGNERLDIINRQEVERTQEQTDANKKRLEKEKEHLKEINDANKKANEDILKLQQENSLSKIKDERERAIKKNEFDLQNSIKEVENSKASTEKKNALIFLLEQQSMYNLTALKEKFFDEDQKKEEERRKERQKNNEEALVKSDELAQKNYENQQRLADEAFLKSIQNEDERRRVKADLDEKRAKETEQLAYDKKIADLEKMQIDEFEKNSLLQQINAEHQLNLTAIEQQGHEARIKNEQAAYQAKIALWQQTGDALNQLSELVGRTTGTGKALALAQVAINTGIAISELLKASNGNPLNLLTGGAAGALQFATGMLKIVATAAKAKSIISSAKTPPGGGGSGGGGGNISAPSTPSATAPIAPQMSQTAINQQLVNQVGNAATRAYVVESDVSGKQERIQRLNRAARIN